MMRGRLSGIEELPPKADAIVAWAIEQVQKRQLTQLAIVERVNAELDRLGIDARISRSGFNRWVTRCLAEGFPPRRAATDPVCCPACGAPLDISLKAAAKTDSAKRVEGAFNQPDR